MNPKLTVCLCFLLAGFGVARADEALPQSVQPPTAAPAQKPPAPPLQPPAPPVRSQTQVQQPVGAGQVAAGGQWVYTSQYGWIWMPYGNQYTYEGTAYDASPYSYVYYPSYGWLWLPRRLGFGAGVRIRISDSWVPITLAGTPACTARGMAGADTAADSTADTVVAVAIVAGMVTVVDCALAALTLSADSAAALVVAAIAAASVAAITQLADSTAALLARTVAGEAMAVLAAATVAGTADPGTPKAMGWSGGESDSRQAWRPIG